MRRPPLHPCACAPPQVWPVAPARGSNYTVAGRSFLVKDRSCCYEVALNATHALTPRAAGSTALVFDTPSLVHALVTPTVGGLLIVQNFTLDTSVVAATSPVPISRPVVVTGCHSSSIDLNKLHTTIFVTSGGRLRFQGPQLSLLNAKRMVRVEWPSENVLLLDSVNVNGTGAVELVDVVLTSLEAAASVQVRCCVLTRGGVRCAGGAAHAGCLLLCVEPPAAAAAHLRRAE